MDSAVVRCTACLGVSRVEMGALGFTVRCPRCDATFVAVEEVEHPAPIRRERNPMLPAPEPLPLPVPAPTRPQRRRIDSTADLESKPVPEPNHDPHHASYGPLPASVLIGLALLPFAIPILWLIAPAVTGVEPAMSIATPSALALAASILCLAVIYTIDWTPTTRIKGVLMLVGLAYFGAVSLYFLKKEMVERIKRFTGLEDRIRWQLLNTGDYQVKLPGPAQPVEAGDAPIRSFKIDFWKSTCDRPTGRLAFVVGSGAVPDRVNDDDPRPGTDDWFNMIAQEIVAHSGGVQKDEPTKLKYLRFFPGRQLEIRLGDEGIVRVVRIYLIKGRLYYLSGEGFDLSPHDSHAQPFFDSFHVPRAQD